ncbi:class I adenylate-forming enzyme family protein [Acinetobacter larvae]|nr:AMP-binding protein [Acinetobacter larvae]
MHLSQLLQQRASLSPQQPALVYGDLRLNFAELAQRSQRLANYLQQQGIQQGDRIAIYAKNSDFLATAVFASSYIGAVVVILNWRLQVNELQYILQDSTPSAMLYDNGFGEQVRTLSAHTSIRVLLAGQHSTVHPSYPDIIAEQRFDGQLPMLEDAEQAAVIMYTSGTTGKPKGAVLSHRALVATAQSNSCTLSWNSDHRFLLVAPMFHIGGLSPWITNVLKGCTTILLADFNPVHVWQLIAQEGVTSMMTVPVMLQALLQVAQKTTVDHSSLSWITCGASAVPYALITAGLALGLNIQQVYGITEFCGAVCFWTPAMGLDYAKSHGQAALGVQVKIVDPVSLAPVAIGQEGEIWCKGAMRFSHYWNNPAATAASFVDGWYRTGDIGRLDAQHFVYVVDRLKDMIISGGENIYPAELEASLMTHPAVQDVAVIGVADAHWGEIPVAYVVSNAEHQVDEQQLIQHCRQQLAAYKCIKAVRFIAALPRNGIGKVIKSQLQQHDLAMTSAVH